MLRKVWGPRTQPSRPFAAAQRSPSPCSHARLRGRPASPTLPSSRPSSRPTVDGGLRRLWSGEEPPPGFHLHCVESAAVRTESAAVRAESAPGKSGSAPGRSGRAIPELLRRWRLLVSIRAGKATGARSRHPEHPRVASVRQLGAAPLLFHSAATKLEAAARPSWRRQPWAEAAAARFIGGSHIRGNLHRTVHRALQPASFSTQMDPNQPNDGSQGGFPGGNIPPYQPGWNPYMYGYQGTPSWFPQGYPQIPPNVSMMHPSPQVFDPTENTMASMQKDDKDVEEIPVSSAPKGKEKRTKVATRTKLSNFNPEEDQNLVMSWLEISNDPIKERTLRSLQSRWDIIKAEVGKFASIYADVVRENPSGMSDADKTTHAVANFAGILKHNFQFLNCWELMKDEPKWLDPKSRAFAQSAGGRGFREDTINLGDDNPDPNASAEKRPMGRDRAKALKNKANSDAGSASSSDYASRMQDLSLQRITMIQEESVRKNERFQQHLCIEQQRYEEMRSHNQSLLVVEQEKVRIMREKHDRENEEKEKQEDERIIRIDLDTCTPAQRAYYQALQDDIMEKIAARRRKRPEH